MLKALKLSVILGLLRKTGANSGIKVRNLWTNPLNIPQKVVFPHTTSRTPVVFTYMGILSYLGLSKSQEDEESLRDKTIKLIKMAMLAKEEGKFDISEQMYHLALKSAQEQMDFNGVTYIYDCMANLALDAGFFLKAEKLFKEVLQRLVSIETPTNDNSVLEISIKLAGIYSHEENNEEADSGFSYCFKHLDDKLKLDEYSSDEDTKLLLAMCADGYAKHLMKLQKYSEAEQYFSRAFEICSVVNGFEHPQTLVLLNNLGSANTLAGNYPKAIEHFSIAITQAKKTDCADLSAFYRNMGMVYLEMGEADHAERYCKRASVEAKSKENAGHLREAQSCLDAVRQARSNN